MVEEISPYEWEWHFIPLTSLDANLRHKLLLDADAEIVEHNGAQGVWVELRKIKEQA